MDISGSISRRHRLVYVKSSHINKQLVFCGKSNTKDQP